MAISMPYALDGYDIRFKRIKTNNIELNVAEAGEGPVVFLLHGFPECWASWGPQIKFLLDHGYKVVVPEMRGYGESDAPDGVDAYDTLELAADVVGLFDAYDQSQGLVIGHDWGSIVAWHTAWLHPGRVKGVGGLSVPWFGRGEEDQLSSLKRQLQDKYFYIIDFQNDAAHKELNQDQALSLQIILTGEANLLNQDDTGQSFLDRFAVPDVAPEHMPQDFIDYISTRYTKNGFTPPLNWYRNFERTWQRTQGMDSTIVVPAMYLTGVDDWTHVYASQAGLDMNVQCRDLRINETINAGHWLGQEKPDWVNAHILKFLRELQY